MSFNKPYYSDDYAGFSTKTHAFYYGYEIEQDGEWCFEVSERGERVFILPLSKLGMKQSDEPMECLLRGVQLWMSSEEQ